MIFSAAHFRRPGRPWLPDDGRHAVAINAAPCASFADAAQACSPLRAAAQGAHAEAMAKYGKKASRKVGKALHEMKAGTLRSGSGRKVKNPQQAIAIGLSEARREGDKVPRRHK